MREVRAGPAKGRAHRIEIPLIDLRLQHRGLQHKMIAAIRQVFDSSIFITGPSVMGFEEEMADLCDTKFAIGVASGTDALTLSLIALGIGPGDEVLLPTFAYAAAAAAICHAGATPVFVDSLADGFNIDPQDAARRTTRRARAIIPVHLYGEAAQMDEIMALAGKHDLHVVEDVAQAAGGKWGEQRLGSIGSTGCFSFYPTKNLAGCGDGGMVVTNDEAVASRVRLLRQQGDASALGGKKFHHPAVGYNSRLDEVQAAVPTGEAPAPGFVEPAALASRRAIPEATERRGDRPPCGEPQGVSRLLPLHCAPPAARSASAAPLGARDRYGGLLPGTPALAGGVPRVGVPRGRFPRGGASVTAGAVHPGLSGTD